MPTERITAVHLLTEVVDEIDRALSAYPEQFRDRSELVMAAITRLLTDLAAEQKLSNRAPRSRRDARTAGRRQGRLSYSGLSHSLNAFNAGLPRFREALLIKAPAPDAPISDLMAPRPEHPTIGIHNRDWPTLWAASELGKVSREDSPTRFETWIEEIVAWGSGLGYLQMKCDDDAEDLDLTGLPIEYFGKRDKAAVNRFRTHFVSDRRHRGPLFGLGLAYVDETTDVVSLTTAGAAVLTALDGCLPTAHDEVPPEWRHAFLTHLARHVPSDFDFLSLLVRTIAEGTAEREPLLRLVQETKDADPSDAVRRHWQKKASERWSMMTSTNVSGFISRAREWDLILPKQEQRRYLLTDDALDALAAAERAAAG